MIISLFVSKLAAVFALPSVASWLCQGFSKRGLGTPGGLFIVLQRSPTKRENLFTKNFSLKDHNDRMWFGDLNDLTSRIRWRSVSLSLLCQFGDPW